MNCGGVIRTRRCRTALRLIAAYILLAGVVAAQEPAAETTTYDVEAEETLFRLLNQARAERGLPELKLDTRLRRAAREHAVAMARHNTLGHLMPGEEEPPERMGKTGARFDRDAENVSVGGTPEGAHEGYMNSAGHRANILSLLYNAVGIGAVFSGERLWVTEDFAHVLPELSNEQAEDLVADSLIKLHLFPGLQRVRAPALRRAACDMGKAGRLDTGRAMSLPDVRYAVTYTAAEPEILPQGVVEMRDRVQAQRFGVGACFLPGKQYPAGIYWVVLAVF